jgi:hypothetical protein
MCDDLVLGPTELQFRGSTPHKCDGRTRNGAEVVWSSI